MTARATSVEASSKTITALEPAAVWRFFAGLAAVPRPSKHEQQVRAHVRRTAETLGLKAREDGVGNVIVDVPATPGCERAAITVLQGHLDMVPEKNTGTQHDFERDPIRPIIDQDAETGEPIVRAVNTTLGADNGIGVSLALAAASTPGVVHGPLELLFTVDEEAGMTGAKALGAQSFRGRRMINLDSEEDDAIYIGCAGGCDMTLRWTLPTTPMAGGDETCRVTVAGLRGGHSGCDIHLNRGSAIKLLAQTLLGGARLQLLDLQGGSKRNAIPREASALVAGSKGTLDALRRVADAVQADAIRDCREPAGTIRVEPEATRSAAAGLTAEDTQRLLVTLAALPHGVLAVVPEIAGLIQTSNSVSTATTERTDAGALRIAVGCLARSSSATQLETTLRQIASVGALAGAAIERGDGYPGWQPDVKSPTLAACKTVYERLFGATPRIAAIHAGLECGIIGERIGGMDMVSFGPRIVGPHSPDECVYIASVEKTWRYLTAVLAELAKS